MTENVNTPRGSQLVALETTETHCLLETPSVRAQREITFICWNIRGIMDKVFYNDIQKLLFTDDIVLLNETHTSNTSQNMYDVILGYIYKKNILRKFIHPLAPGPSGGIGIYINSKLIEGIDLICTDESFVWLRLKSSFFGRKKDKMIACVYFSPSDSTYIHSTNARTDYYSIIQEQIATFIN